MQSPGGSMHVGKSSLHHLVVRRSSRGSKCWRWKNNPPKKNKQQKNSTKESIYHSNWAYPHHPSLQPMMPHQLNWVGTRICLFKTTNLLLQPLQKSESLLRDCWANAACLFQNREESLGLILSNKLMNIMYSSKHALLSVSNIRARMRYSISIFIPPVLFLQPKFLNDR